MDTLIYALSFTGKTMSESDKKVLIALLFIVLLIILLFGYLQKLVGWIMYNQGLAIDTMMYDIIRTGVIKDKKTFKREAYRKSDVLFLKQAWLPFVGLLVFVALLLGYGWSTSDPGLSYFGKAWNEMFPPLNWHISSFFGLNIPTDWVSMYPGTSFNFSLDNGGTFYAGKFVTIVVLLGLLIFGIWYLVRIQGYMARSMRVRQLCRTYFNKDLNKIAVDHA